MSIVDLLNRKTTPALALIAVLLPVFGGMAMSAQDKYSVQVPDGLAFAEFRGYEAMAGHRRQPDRRPAGRDPWQS